MEPSLQLSANEGAAEAREFLTRFEEAVVSRRAGDLVRAEQLLLPSVEPPSIYHGHYRELFLIYRAWNKRDLNARAYDRVIQRVLMMVRLDAEMVTTMTRYWSRINGKKVDCGSYTKLKLSDAKVLLAAAEACSDSKAKREALRLQKRFAVVAK